MGRLRGIITRIPSTVLTVRVQQVTGGWTKVADAKNEEEANRLKAVWQNKGWETAVFENSRKRRT